MKNNSTRNIIKTAIILIVVGIITNGIYLIANTLANPYTREIKTVSIDGPGYTSSTPGSWHIDKSAKWIDVGKAEVTFDVTSKRKVLNNYKDVILVMDVSGSMEGDKLNRAKEDAHELIDTLLSDTNNKAALITFESTSVIKSNLTNNKTEMLNLIDNLTAGGNTNYNAGLNNALQVLNGYQKQNNRDIVLLFMTDGYPNTDTPNQIGTYEKIKDEYPYIKVSGIQYEMGQDVINEIKEISDVQFVADQTNLSNILFEASGSLPYEKFEIVDYIHDDYFYVESVNDIKVPSGEVQLLPDGNGQKVIWTLDNLYTTGKDIQMKINLTLKNGIREGIEYYPTNRGEDITSKLPDEEQKKTESDKTPVLKGKYKVIYDKNLPNGCSNSTSIPEEKYLQYEKVTKSNTELTCPNYNFKGWEIIPEDSSDITKINDEVFVMPAHDVTIRGIWTKQSVTKSMDGTVHENKTLYKYVKEDITNNNKGSLYTGTHNDSLDGNGTENIYYYTSTGSNNVIFANFCWNIIRTTDTGGVKIVYNGVPSVDGKCNNTGTNSQIGTSTYSINLSTERSPAYLGYMYNPDVVKEGQSEEPASESIFGNGVKYTNGKYILTNISTTLDENHHYTCNNTSGTCSTVRYYYYGTCYMELNGEANIEELLDNMLWRSDVNKVNSGIKTTIDTWYENNMTGYTSYLEDAVWCNDRSLANTGDYTYQNSGFNPNGGSIFWSGENEKANLNFKHGYWLITNLSDGDLSCSKDTDKFTTGNTKAKLDYPVGLLTGEEHYLGGSNVFATGSYYWLASPSSFLVENIAFISGVFADGSVSNDLVSLTRGVRPAVSLARDTNVTSGDGSVNTPYIIDTN